MKPADGDGLKSFFEVSEDIFMVLDSGAVVLDCRVGKNTRQKLPVENFLGMPVESILPPEAAESVRKGIRCAAAGDEPFSVGFSMQTPEGECTHIGENGEPMSFNVMLTPVRHQGKPFFCAVWRNVTEQLRREEEQCALAERLRAKAGILSRVAGIESGVDGDIARFSREVTALIGETLDIDRVSFWEYHAQSDAFDCISMYEARSGGYTAAHAITKRDFPVFHRLLGEAAYVIEDKGPSESNDRSFYKKYMEPLDLTTVLSYNVMYRGRRMGLVAFAKRGQEYTWKPDEITFCGQIADQIGIAFINRERVQITRALQKSETILNRAQAVSGTGYWYHDIAAKSVAWSEEACRIFGQEPGAPASMEKLLSLVYPEDRQMVRKAWDDAVICGSFALRHRSVVRGEIRWISQSGEMMYGSRGRPAACLGIVQDITEQLQNQKELDDYRNQMERMVESRTAELENDCLTEFIRKPPEDQIAVEAALETELKKRGGAKILLVEDNLLNREVVSRLLVSAGMEVSVAENGQVAVNMAGMKRYDLILMDVQMPVMDGLQATRAIREMPGCLSAPIIAMTANAFEEDRQKCLDSGMNDHMSKPVAPELLYRMLSRWLPQGVPDPAPDDCGPAGGGDSSAEAGMLAALKSIDGLDVAAGLQVLRGDTLEYARLLRRFADNHGGDADSIMRFGAAGAVEDARQSVHALKGVSGMLGIKQVQRLCSEIERMLASGSSQMDLQVIARELSIEMGQLVSALRSMLPETDGMQRAPADAPQDTAGAEELMARLSELLEANNIAAGDLYAGAKAQLAAAYGGAAVMLGRQIEEFDYLAALESIQGMRKE